MAREAFRGSTSSRNVMYSWYSFCLLIIILCRVSFPPAIDFSLFMVEAPEGGNVLTKEIVDIAFQLDEKVLALEASIPCVIELNLT